MNSPDSRVYVNDYFTIAQHRQFIELGATSPDLQVGSGCQAETKAPGIGFPERTTQAFMLALG